MSDTPNVALRQGLLGIPIGLLVAVLALIGVLLMPLPADLPVAGQRVLAILVFAVVVWITEAVSY